MNLEHLKLWMEHALMATQSMLVPQIMIMIVTNAGLRKTMIEFAHREFSVGMIVCQGGRAGFLMIH